ncbi:gamma-glutamyl-gamma-aminobutyrate hydrolase family protein [Devosia sp.]|uniref:gamma-glutamyl-gamma-aminobutyrate hydrolase family protein n=1 Tax=Devosia sp. TaxID=1871048 RepID=UPI002F0EAF25
MTTPIVLISTDVRVADGYRWHATPQTYLDAVRDGAGVIPLSLPNLGGTLDLDGLLDRVDGVVLTGSRSNVHPSRYGGEASVAHEPYDQDRDRVSFELVRKALEKHVPVLAICRGMQELNVALGGTLATEIQELPGRMDHRAPQSDLQEARFAIRHPVEVRERGLLRDIVEAPAVEVNSLHRQAIDVLAPGLKVEATAADGTIEAVSAESAGSFALGVQWHPEYWFRTDTTSARILAAFGDAVRAYAARKGAGQ